MTVYLTLFKGLKLGHALHQPDMTRLTIATSFGRYSRRVWRAFIGAVWSFPLRYVTYGSLFFTSLHVYSSTGSTFLAVSVGVSGGVLLRFIENLLVEFWLFPTISKFFTKG